MESDHSQSKPSQQKLANFTFLILGMISLAPWNAVISSQDYYKTKCKYKNFHFVFILPNIAATFLFSFLILFKSTSLSHTIKIYIPLILSVLFMLLTPATAYILDKTYGYILFFIAVFFSASLTAIIQMCVMGIAGQTSQLLTYFAIGTGVSGILTSLIRIIDLLVFQEGLKDAIKKAGQVENNRFIGEMVYYIINVLFFAIAGFLFQKWLQKNDECGKTYTIVKGNNNGQYQQNLLEKNEINQEEDNIQISSNQYESSIWYVFKKSLHYQLLILLITTQTFFLFPGIALKKQLSILNMDWKNAFLLLVFNFSDTLGKGLNLLIGNFSKCRLTVFCILRLIITLPFMMLAKDKKFYLFQCNWFPFVLMFLFGVTSGFGFNQIIVLAAKLFHGKRQIEICEQLLFIMFTCGTTFGTFIAFGISKI